MNVFLPYESFKKCAQVLDDRRLIKQILECKQIIAMNERKKEDDSYSSPYLNHPVVKHYANQEHHIVEYALEMCREYEFRFNRFHTYHYYFIHKMRPFENEFSPIYAEGSKNSPLSIRRYDELVYSLFRMKLTKKWNEDVRKNRCPKWTNRPEPEFYNKEINHD